MSVGARQVVAVIRGNKRNARLARKSDQIAIDARLYFHALVLNFQEEITFAENVAQAVRVRPRLLVFFREQRVGHFAAQARGKRDQSLAVLREKIVIHARLVIKAVEKPGRNQLDEVAIAFVVFAEQDEMIRSLCLRAAILVVVRSDVDFAADDRLYPVRGGLVIEVGGSEEIAMVRHGDRGHPAPRRFGGQFADFASAIQQGVVRVQMQMYEVGRS